MQAVIKATPVLCVSGCKEDCPNLTAEVEIPSQSNYLCSKVFGNFYWGPRVQVVFGLHWQLWPEFLMLVMWYCSIAQCHMITLFNDNIPGSRCCHCNPRTVWVIKWKEAGIPGKEHVEVCKCHGQMLWSMGGCAWVPPSGLQALCAGAWRYGWTDEGLR